MLLAELEVFHTRPAVPTRRIALGNLVLPVDPAPGFGGLLLGAVVAQHITGVDTDLQPDVVRLIRQIERNERIVQPRLRHRFQVDRHGLAVSRHRMIGEGDDVEFDFASTGSDLAQVLGAVYAVERLDLSSRRVVAPVLEKGTKWRGPIGPALVAHLAGSNSTALASLADPLAWAREILGFPADVGEVSKREVTKQYRRRMRDVHPDHGGAAIEASKAILDLNEARRILSAGRS
ncbi:MAG: J domain-containing protein [Acidimicrobiia bacterium]